MTRRATLGSFKYERLRTVRPVYGLEIQNSLPASLREPSDKRSEAKTLIARFSLKENPDSVLTSNAQNLRFVIYVQICRRYSESGSVGIPVGTVEYVLQQWFCIRYYVPKY
jgi:hypothetical protein